MSARRTGFKIFMAATLVLVAAFFPVSTVGAGVLAAEGASPVGAFGLSLPGNLTAYVANNSSQSVTTIDVATSATTTIAIGPGPSAVAITPDGETAYVIGDFGSVTPIDLATNTPGAVIPVGFQPGGIAITPDGETAYVTIASGNYVTPIDLATNTTGNPITVGSTPFGIAITPDGKTAYVTNAGDNTVTPIVVATNTAGAPIHVGSRSFGTPVAVAITPDGKTAYVTNYGDNTVTPITVETNAPGTPITVLSSFPTQGVFGIAIAPDGKTAYVANWRGANTVTPIDLATNATGTPISVGNTPFGIAITPDGRTAYVTSQEGNGTVTPIDLTTNTPGPAIAVGGFPQGITIAVTPVVADRTPPVLALPANIEAAATGPTGTTVTYTATATDAIDGQVIATCAPASGSTFSIGTTRVDCGAADQAGNTASGSFTVHVKGAAEQLTDLRAAVQGVGPGRSLSDTIEDAQAALAKNDVPGTCSILKAFVNAVKAQSGKSISAGTATTLIGDVTRVRAVLAC